MEENKNKFNIGDKVKIINYGSIISESKTNKPEVSLCKNMKFIAEDSFFTYYDMCPELVGKEAIVKDFNYNQIRYSYILDVIGGGKSAWYNEQQLELISKNTNIR